MPSRNINLTDHYDGYVAKALASGKYKNASEVIRAGLRLLERQEAEDAAKIEALRASVRDGIQAYERGEYVAMETPGDIDSFFDDIAAEGSAASQ